MITFSFFLCKSLKNRQFSIYEIIYSNRKPHFCVLAGYDGGMANYDSLVVALESGASGSEIAAWLEGMSIQQRVRVVAAVKGPWVGKLFDRVRDAEPLVIDDLVPATTPAGATITYAGRNSLPLFSRFQKRFTRSADGLVFGYNHQPFRIAGKVTGPGYFVVADAGEQRPGELLFDYTQPPPFEPSGWPPYRPNDVLGARFVFMDMHDYVRRVARGVVVGSAFRRGKDQNTYFSLTSIAG